MQHSFDGIVQYPCLMDKEMLLRSALRDCNDPNITVLTAKQFAKRTLCVLVSSGDLLCLEVCDYETQQFWSCLG